MPIALFLTTLIMILASNGAASGGAGGWTAPQQNVGEIQLIITYFETILIKLLAGQHELRRQEGGRGCPARADWILRS